MNKKEKESNRLSDEFDQIQDPSNNFDISNHLAKMGDLPDLGQIEIYDYESDLTVATQKAIEVIESLVDLYLGEFDNLTSHPYIRNKVKEDAMVYAETLFLSKMTRKNFLTQMKQVDNGDNGARMHEVINQTISEIRENSKFASTQRNELEKYYKEFRQDLSDVAPKINKDGGDSGDKVVDNKSLNDYIDKALKNRRSQ